MVDKAYAESVGVEPTGPEGLQDSNLLHYHYANLPMLPRLDSNQNEVIQSHLSCQLDDKAFSSAFFFNKGKITFLRYIPWTPILLWFHLICALFSDFVIYKTVNFSFNSIIIRETPTFLHLFFGE